MKSLKYRNRSTRQMAALAGNPIWKALSKNAPMPVQQQVDVALASRASLDEILNGRGVYDHVNDLTCSSHIAIVLAERGYGEEYMPLLLQAHSVVAAWRVLAIAKQTLEAAPEDVAIVREMLDVHEAQNATADHTEVASAIFNGLARVGSRSTVAQ